MVLCLSKTFVDDDEGESITWNIALSGDELVVIEDVAKNGMPSPSDGLDLLVFRGKEYDEDDGVEDLLDSIGTRIVPDHTIHVYVY